LEAKRRIIKTVSYAPRTKQTGKNLLR